jgi:flagellar basal-body rod protein FlgF
MARKLMDSLTITAASGLRARMESLDMLANNIANSETGGYKTDREFYNIYTSADATGADGEDGSALPVIEKNYTDFSQGAIRPTSNPMDFAIQGKGFFTVNSPSGVAYTRNGTFQISSTGTLVTTDGNAVLDTSGKPITLDPSVPVSVSADGTITQAGTTAAQIALVDFADPGSLAKQGNTMFRPSDPKTQPTAAPAGSEIQQGRLEGSNVSSSEAAVRLVSVMRQFEMMQKAITIGKEMDAKTISEVAKVGA